VSFLLAFLVFAFYLSTFFRPANNAVLFLFIVSSLIFSFVAILLGRDQNDPRWMIPFPRRAPSG